MSYFQFGASTDNAARNGWVLWCPSLDNGKLFSQMIFHGALIFISLILNEAMHLFLFTGPWISFFVKVVLNYFANFSIRFSVFFLLIYRILYFYYWFTGYMFVLHLPLSVVHQYIFFYYCEHLLHCPNSVHWWMEFLNFSEVKFIYLFPLWYSFYVFCLRHFPQFPNYEAVLYFSLQSVIVFVFTLADVC